MSVGWLQARVELADPEAEVRRSRAPARRGDATWRRRLARYERGETRLVALSASAVIEGGGRRSELRCFCHEVVWVDRPVAVEALTDRMVDLARRDFGPVASGLRDSGILLSAGADSIAVRLAVAPAVAQRLDRGGPRCSPEPAVRAARGPVRTARDRVGATNAAS